jgi:hypothetical protein
MHLGKREIISVLNWTNTPQDISIQLLRRTRLTDFWSDAAFGTHSSTFEIKQMPGRSGRLLVCE